MIDIFWKILHEGFVSVDISEKIGEIITSSDPQMILKCNLVGIWGTFLCSSTLVTF